MTARIQGLDHAETLTSRSNLASSLRTSGRTDEAISQMHQALDGAARSLSDDHPLTTHLSAQLAQMTETS